MREIIILIWLLPYHNIVNYTFYYDTATWHDGEKGKIRIHHFHTWTLREVGWVLHAVHFTFNIQAFYNVVCSFHIILRTYWPLSKNLTEIFFFSYFAFFYTLSGLMAMIILVNYYIYSTEKIDGPNKRGKIWQT